ncbi:MAG: hypothetical protein ACOYKZ_03515 [Chlamydiia bacterium]
MDQEATSTRNILAMIGLAGGAVLFLALFCGASAGTPALIGGALLLYQALTAGGALVCAGLLFAAGLREEPDQQPTDELELDAPDERPPSTPVSFVRPAARTHRDRTHTERADVIAEGSLMLAEPDRFFSRSVNDASSSRLVREASGSPRDVPVVVTTTVHTAVRWQSKSFVSSDGEVFAQ